MKVCLCPKVRDAKQIREGKLLCSGTQYTVQISRWGQRGTVRSEHIWMSETPIQCAGAAL